MMMPPEHLLMTACPSNFLALLVWRCEGKSLAAASDGRYLVKGDIFCERRYLALGVVVKWGTKAIFHSAPSMPLIFFFLNIEIFGVQLCLSKSLFLSPSLPFSFSLFLSISLSHTQL